MCMRILLVPTCTNGMVRGEVDAASDAVGYGITAAAVWSNSWVFSDMPWTPSALFRAPCPDIHTVPRPSRPAPAADVVLAAPARAR